VFKTLLGKYPKGGFLVFLFSDKGGIIGRSKRKGRPGIRGGENSPKERRLYKSGYKGVSMMIMSRRTPPEGY